MALSKERKALRRIEESLTIAAYHELVNVRDLVGSAEACLANKSDRNVATQRKEHAVALLRTHVSDMQAMLQELLLLTPGVLASVQYADSPLVGCVASEQFGFRASVNDTTTGRVKVSLLYDTEEKALDVACELAEAYA